MGMATEHEDDDLDDDDLDDDDLDEEDLDDDLAEIVRASLEEEEPEVTDAQIEALLADPTFARIAAAAVLPHEETMTEKGLAGARRTLAVVFLTDPSAMALLARAREAGPPPATAFKGDSVPAPSRRGRGPR
jgi:hypothetical protein